jgi:hypothetical protein
MYSNFDLWSTVTGISWRQDEPMICLKLLKVLWINSKKTEHLPEWKYRQLAKAFAICRAHSCQSMYWRVMSAPKTSSDTEQKKSSRFRLCPLPFHLLELLSNISMLDSVTPAMVLST